MVGPLHRTAAVRRGVDEVAVAGDRRPPELEAEEVREDQADPDRMRRDPDQDERHRRSVEQGSGSQRGEDADRKREQHPEDRSAEDERGGDRRGVADDRVDALPVREREAEVLVDDQPVEELRVLDVERPVGAEEVRRALHVGVGRGLAGDELRGVVRDEEEEDVGDERHRDEQHRSPDHSTCEIPDHGLDLPPPEVVAGVHGAERLYLSWAFPNRHSAPETREAPAQIAGASRAVLLRARPSYLRKKVLRSALALAGWKR